MMRSNSRAPRRMMSTWPLVSGSNDPGKHRHAVARRGHASSVVAGAAWPPAGRTSPRCRRPSPAAPARTAPAARRRRPARRVLQHQRAARRQPRRRPHSPPRPDRRRHTGDPAGQVEPPVGGQLAQCARELVANHNIAIRDAAVREVGAAISPRRGRSCVDKHHARGAPRLSASMPSAPEPAKPSSTPRALDDRRQDRRTDVSLSRSDVGRRPGPRRRLQPPSLVAPGDHAHADTLRPSRA